MPTLKEVVEICGGKWPEKMPLNIIGNGDEADKCNQQYVRDCIKYNEGINHALDQLSTIEIDPSKLIDVEKLAIILYCEHYNHPKSQWKYTPRGGTLRENAISTRKRFRKRAQEIITTGDIWKEAKGG